MHSPARTLFTGAAIAIVLALVAIVPRIGRVDTWKIVLGLLGVTLFISAGRERQM
jgi:hypothetical protein